MARYIAVVAALAGYALATPALVKRDHVLTISNRCGSRAITPVYTDVSQNSYRMATLQPGEATATSVGESQLAWRVWADAGEGCVYPDGPGCLLFECSFDNPDFRQCNLSRVSGMGALGMEFSFSDPGCGANACTRPDCDGNSAFTTPDDGGPSLRQCNTPNVGINVVFSCDY